MKEKRYPIFEEEENVGMCSEPAVMEACSDTANEIVPILGPSSWEEAMADLDESERQFEAGESIPWDNVMNEIQERYKHYAN